MAIYKNSKTVNVMRYGEAGPGPNGSVMAATFRLDGQEFTALNGGPMFTFSPAISFFLPRFCGVIRCYKVSVSRTNRIRGGQT